MKDTIIVTGGAGFIGANFVLRWLRTPGRQLVNLDKLTYAGNPQNLSTVAQSPNYAFVHGDIGDANAVRALLEQHQPRAIVNFAAESHVDRSIHGPQAFVETNVVGTSVLLQEALHYWRERLSMHSNFRFLHVSTDEVYGTLSPDAPAFTEHTQYAPNSPYAASKAASDHLVRAFHHTYGLPVLTTNCSNNYGPFQFPEKLIPLIIHNALSGKALPIYGDGKQIRDWLYVEDHCAAIELVLARGRVGEVYNVGGNSEKLNIDVVNMICTILDELRPDARGESYAKLMTFVKDRPGHDRRYAIDCTKIRSELGWQPSETFETGIRKTVQWYLDHAEWVRQVTSAEYRSWVQQQYQTA